jgi:hypothetical protein
MSETRDVEDLADRLGCTGRRQVAAVVQYPPPGPDQYGQGGGGVQEVDLLHVHHEMDVARLDLLEQDVPEAGAVKMSICPVTVMTVAGPSRRWSRDIRT